MHKNHPEHIYIYVYAHLYTQRRQHTNSSSKEDYISNCAFISTVYFNINMTEKVSKDDEKKRKKKLWRKNSDKLIALNIMCVQQQNYES